MHSAIRKSPDPSVVDHRIGQHLLPFGPKVGVASDPSASFWVLKLRSFAIVALDYTRFVRHAPSATELSEVLIVDGLAGALFRHLHAVEAEIARVHIFNAQSSAVQSIVAELLRDRLGFTEEVVLTPELGFVTSARPDFYFSLAEGRGVLAEVERGGTTTNNHDLKDLWKTHIAMDAQHLFLVVPIANWNAQGRAREKPFMRVSRRLGAFFGDQRREVDVLSVHVFGYGTLTLDQA